MANNDSLVLSKWYLAMLKWLSHYMIYKSMSEIDNRDCFFSIYTVKEWRMFHLRFVCDLHFNDKNDITDELLYLRKLMPLIPYLLK